MELWDAFQHLLFWLEMALIWWLWTEYKRYRLDKTRQRLFAVRDKLFLDAAKGSVAFDSEAYLLIRGLLNRAIQYTERVTLMRVVMVRSTIEKYGLQRVFLEKMRHALNGLDDTDQKRIIVEALKEADRILITHLVRSNFLLFLFVEVARLFHLMELLMKKLSKTIKSVKRIMNNDIFMDDSLLFT